MLLFPLLSLTLVIIIECQVIDLGWNNYEVLGFTFCACFCRILNQLFVFGVYIGTGNGYDMGDNMLQDFKDIK